MITKRAKSERGIALLGVIIFTLIFTILGFSAMYLAGSEAILSQGDVKRTQAFYLAEAGIARLTTQLLNKESENIDETALENGSYTVTLFNEEDPPYAISTGKVGNAEKSIKIELAFLAPAFDDAVYGASSGGSAGDWRFSLRGQGDPYMSSGREIGGKDVINGNVTANGGVDLYEQSSINPAPTPNSYSANGDVEATGDVTVHDSASISGAIQTVGEMDEPPDLVGMNYAAINTHNVSQFFANEGVNSGHLPSEHELYDIVVKNPSNRSDETASTAGDDFFFEPASGFSLGSEKSGGTPLNVGQDRIYYVDGDVWIHSKSTYGFILDGKVTIVATGDIHISDNIEYANNDSLLGLVALGKYDSSGNISSGGNIYFGDPRYGTTYSVSGMMFAANDFLYNTDSVTGGTEEPETGFSIFGNLTGLNHVSIRRDWYDDSDSGDALPAYYLKNSDGSGQWIDLKSGTALSSGEINSLRHYQMKITYDERVNDPETQPPGLPRGGGTIFAGFEHWEEL
jgi:hypothetical protein